MASGMPPNPDGMPPYFGARGAQPGPSVSSNQASPIPGGLRGYAHPGQRSGAPTPSNMLGPNFPSQQGMPTPQQQQQMFVDQQMRNYAAAQRMNPNPRMQPVFFSSKSTNEFS